MNSVHTELKHVCTAVLDIGFSVFIVFKSIEGAICSINLNEIKNLELVLIKKGKSHGFILYINIFKHNRLLSL